MELSPGIGESISGGMVNMFANVLGFVEINLIQYLGSSNDPNDKYEINDAMIVILGCLVTATVILYFVKIEERSDFNNESI